MIEIKGDLWNPTIPDGIELNAICITTNGHVKENGEAVMGRGCAKEAATKDPTLPCILGSMLLSMGNHVHYLKKLSIQGKEVVLYSFPVKHDWYKDADPRLIVQSCTELINKADKNSFQCVVLPRPGCGCGKLDWNVVKPILEKYLDDRFYVITY